jgi:enediyne biosynthesis protein E3
MTAVWRALRRRILTPNLRETKLERRGFYEKSPAARELLESVGEYFLTGYAIAAEARSIPEAEDRLEVLPSQFRGFAYEGAGMAFGLRDGLPFGGHWVADFIAGPGARHIYMIYVGVGWALARLPRFRWAAATAALTDPVLRWLALDGYGFHQAYFHTGRYVRGQYQEPDFPWPPEGPSAYASRAIDQGIGRATWFVCGADPDRVAGQLDAFPEPRRPDLYSGAGLAATYAGGVNGAELAAFRDRGRAYLSQIAQGSAFAATARVRAALETPHTFLAADVLCGTTPPEAARICDHALPPPSERGDVPSFELWRRRIADQLTSLQGMNT